MTKSAKLTAGTVVADRYRIEREIGRGGMAQVYEARHTDIGKAVAVKVLAAEFTSSPVVVERFLREARAAAAVHSPYICDVYDSGKLEDGRPFLVMELLKGESLYERMVKVRQFSVEMTARITSQVARGLAKAHSAGIVHRDLKPENIFLTLNEDGELLSKLLDFGLAKFYEPTNDGGVQARLTREGAIFGTPAYMSPEQVQGQGTVDHRADVWALGCIVYECLTGRTVWATDKGIAMTFAQIASAPLPKLLRYRPDLPVSVESWFEKALARTAEDRFQTAKELAESFAIAADLHNSSLLLTGEISRVGPSPIPEELRRLVEQDTGVMSPRPAAGAPASVPIAELTTEPPTPVLFAEPAPVSGPHSAVPSSGSPLAPPPRPVNESLTGDLGSSNTVKRSREAKAAKWPLLLVGVIGVAGGAVGVQQIYQPPKTLPIASSSASDQVVVSVSSPSSSAAPPLSAVAAPSLQEGPRWLPLVNEGQAKILEGDLNGASKLFKEAQDTMSSAVGKAMLDHVSVAKENRGDCKLAALARVRAPTVSSQNTGSPTLVRTPRGLLVLWSDDHETVAHDHVFAQLVDEKTLKLEGNPVDVTPEADRIGKFAVVALEQRVALLYTDRGSQPTLWLRWLDADGRVAAAPVKIAGAKAGGASPALAVEKGALWGVWEEQIENTKTDLVVANLSDVLSTTVEPIRLTDLRMGRFPPRVQIPALAISGSHLLMSMRVDRDAVRAISLLQINMADPALKRGLESSAKPIKEDRHLGRWATLTALKDKGDLPAMACSRSECFAAWNIDVPGQLATFAVAQVDPQRGDVTWSKRFPFAGHGGRPSLGVNEDGALLASWYDNNRIVVAPLTGREGVGGRSFVARAATDRPPASIVGLGEKDWAISWLDFERGKLEPYLLRVSCR